MSSRKEVPRIVGGRIKEEHTEATKGRPYTGEAAATASSRDAKRAELAAKKAADMEALAAKKAAAMEALAAKKAAAMKVALAKERDKLLIILTKAYEIFKISFTKSVIFSEVKKKLETENDAKLQLMYQKLEDSEKKRREASHRQLAKLVARLNQVLEKHQEEEYNSLPIYQAYRKANDDVDKIENYYKFSGTSLPAPSEEAEGVAEFASSSSATTPRRPLLDVELKLKYDPFYGVFEIKQKQNFKWTKLETSSGAGEEGSSVEVDGGEVPNDARYGILEDSGGKGFTFTSLRDPRTPHFETQVSLADLKSKKCVKVASAKAAIIVPDEVAREAFVKKYRDSTIRWDRGYYTEEPYSTIVFVNPLTKPKGLVTVLQVSFGRTASTAFALPSEVMSIKGLDQMIDKIKKHVVILLKPVMALYNKIVSQAKTVMKQTIDKYIVAQAVKLGLEVIDLDKKEQAILKLVENAEKRLLYAKRFERYIGESINEMVKYQLQISSKALAESLEQYKSFLAGRELTETVQKIINAKMAPRASSTSVRTKAEKGVRPLSAVEATTSAAAPLGKGAAEEEELRRPMGSGGPSSPTGAGGASAEEPTLETVHVRPEKGYKYDIATVVSRGEAGRVNVQYEDGSNEIDVDPRRVRKVPTFTKDQKVGVFFESKGSMKFFPATVTGNTDKEGRVELKFDDAKGTTGFHEPGRIFHVPGDYNPSPSASAFGRSKVSKETFVNKYCKKKNCSREFALKKYHRALRMMNL